MKSSYAWGAPFMLLMFLTIQQPAEALTFLKRLFGVYHKNPSFTCNNPPITDAYQNMVVEAKIASFKNGPNGNDDDTYKDTDCEWAPGDQCDYSAVMRIDDDNLMLRWPQKDTAGSGFVEVLREWKRQGDIDAQQAGTTVQAKDYIYTACKNVELLTYVVVRIKLEDVDRGRDDLVNLFNCYWAPKNPPAASRQAAKWETVNCCTALECDMDTDVYHEMKLNLRAYRGNDCPNEGRRP